MRARRRCAASPRLPCCQPLRPSSSFCTLLHNSTTQVNDYPTYTVGAVAVKDEIKAHIHKDGDHVIYIVSGQGKARHDILYSSAE